MEVKIMILGRAQRNPLVPLKKQIAMLREKYSAFEYLYCIRSGLESVIIFTYDKEGSD